MSDIKQHKDGGYELEFEMNSSSCVSYDRFIELISCASNQSMNPFAYCYQTIGFSMNNGSVHQFGGTDSYHEPDFNLIKQTTDWLLTVETSDIQRVFVFFSGTGIADSTPSTLSICLFLYPKQKQITVMIKSTSKELIAKTQNKLLGLIKNQANTYPFPPWWRLFNHVFTISHTMDISLLMMMGLFISLTMVFLSSFISLPIAANLGVWAYLTWFVMLILAVIRISVIKILCAWNKSFCDMNLDPSQSVCDITTI